MTEDDATQPAPRQLDAGDVNRMAQALNDEAAGLPSNPEVFTSTAAAVPAGPTGENFAGAEPAQARSEDPLEVQEVQDQQHLFPPDVDPTIEIGGSPEEQGALRDEYRNA